MGRLGPFYTAIAVFPLLALVGVVPYIALQYRRRGTVGAGHLLLAGAFGLYLIGLAFYVVLPLRPVTSNFCDLYGVTAQLNPLHHLQETRIEHATGGWRAVLGDQYVQQIVLNVILFIPLGMFVRYLMRRGVATTIAIGFGVSLFIELTQLTGDWGLYPCAYRFFETNDLITNTFGAAVGAVCAPMLRAVPAQLSVARPTAPQPVTPVRRLLAAACDAVAITLVGLLLLAFAGLVLEATRGQLFDSETAGARVLRAITLVVLPGSAVTLGVPLLWGGRTPGQWTVLLMPRTLAGLPLSTSAIVMRFLTGPGPLLSAVALGVLGIQAAWWLALALAAFAVVATFVLPVDGGGARSRGGVRVIDARERADA